MKKIKTEKKLRLVVENLRRLTQDELRGVAGGLLSLDGNKHTTE